MRTTAILLLLLALLGGWTQHLMKANTRLKITLDNQNKAIELHAREADNYAQRIGELDRSLDHALGEIEKLRALRQRQATLQPFQTSNDIHARRSSLLLRIAEANRAGSLSGSTRTNASNP